MGGLPPAADKFTGETAGKTSGGTQLYKLKDGSVTSQKPPSTVQITEPIKEQPTDEVAPGVARIPFKEGLTPQQQIGIDALVGSGRAFNQADAENFAFATGQSDASIFIGKTGQEALTAIRSTEPIKVDEEERDIAVDISDVKDTQLQQKSTEMNATLERVKQAVKDAPAGGDTPANKNFINAVAQGAKGRDASAEELQNLDQQTLNQVLTNFGVGEQVEGMGITEAPEGRKILNEEELKKFTDAGLSDADISRFPNAQGGEDIFINPDSDFLKKVGATGDIIEEKISATTEAPSEFVDDTTKVEDAGGEETGEATGVTSTSPITNAFNNLIDIKKGLVPKGVELDPLVKAKNEADLAVETARQTIVDKNLLDAVELEGISKNQPIPMAIIRRQQEQFTQDEYIENLMNVQDYNNKLILANMAAGNLTEAQRINQDIASDNFEIASLQIDQLLAEAQIDQQQADSLFQQAEHELDLADSGFTPLNTQTEVDLARANGGKVWLDPVSKRWYLQGAPTGDDFTLSPGQVRFSGGEIIASVPKSATGVPLGAEDLTPQQRTAGTALAKKIYGSSAIKTAIGIETFVNPILQRIAAGETVDDISDDLRLQGQSLEFTGVIRDAAQQITSKLSANKTQTVLDKIDDLIGRDDTGALRDFLKKASIDAAGIEQGKQIIGKERTVKFLDEIANDLKAYEEAGGNTNIFTGTLEDISKKAGGVKDPELRKIAVKITKARQEYRRAMTGVAFSPGENLEYDAVFPSISKTAAFNSATTEALREAFRGDVDFFYGFQMGENAYDQIFKQAQPTAEPTQFTNIDDFLGTATDEQLQAAEELQTKFNLSDQDLIDLLNEQNFETDLNKSVKGSEDVTSFNVGGKRIETDPSIKNRIFAADKEMFKKTGKHLAINQSFRTGEQQEELFKAGKGRVAKPGTSFHEFGLAIDVTNWEEAEPFLKLFGFRNDLKEDKGHFSIGEFA